MGPAPGVGKTFAMLSEGLRRSERGTETVIGALDPDGRVPIVALASRLRDTSIGGELDLSSLLETGASVVLVDELAGRPSPTGSHHHRWQDVEALLASGRDVITTLNVSDIESLSDVAAAITGKPAGPTVPDQFVRSGQIELVDMSPESLRRRLAHGNVFASSAVDAQLADYFRVGNLSALRELALTWVADVVEESLDEYVSVHAISDRWETRERIVVALTGSEDADGVVRRAGRIARRQRGTLIGVHIASENGLKTRAGPALDAHRNLLESLGGTYREIVGNNVAVSLLKFARSERATQVVIGESPTRGPRIFRKRIVDEIIRHSDGLDIHVIGRPASDARTGESALARSRGAGLTGPATERRNAGRSEIAACALLSVGLPSLTFILLRFPSHIGVSASLLLFLTLVLAISAVGGLRVAIPSAFATFFVANWFFIPPRHSLTISSAEDGVALAVFLTVAVVVSALVERVSRQSSDALLARAEAETLARTTATMAGERDPLLHLLEQICSTFRLNGASLLVRLGNEWHTEASYGSAPAQPDAGVAIALDESDGGFLVLQGAALSADDYRVLRTIAFQLRLALEARQHQESAAHLDALAEANAVRTAMLQAVSHDLRTPLAGIKAAATSLLSDEVVWEPAAQRQLLRTVDEECDRLNRIVGNLLDMSKLQAGAIHVKREPTPLDELLDSALSSLSGQAHERRLDLEVQPDLMADVDGSLVERAIANIISNAFSHSPSESKVHIEAAAIRNEVHIRIQDHGPGIPSADRGRAFEAFQRLGDRGGSGVGLGLAVARGLTRATGGHIELDDTPGGGLTVTIRLPRANEEVSHP